MSAFLAAILDTLLPGSPPLPPASVIGVTVSADANRPVLDAIAAEAGGPDGFVAAAPAARTAALQRVERALPEGFRDLVTAALAGYYQSAAVLNLLGWTAETPQPAGHGLAPTGEASWRLLDAVRARAPLWRQVTTDATERAS